MRRALIGLALLILLLSLTASAPPAAAQGSIKPGGTYVVTVTVQKPTHLRFLEDKWEIRAYFYSGTTCYAAGTETAYGYSGWWIYKDGGEEWIGGP